jgi:Zn-dependent M16 (insulinase) family peptidase
MAEITKHTEDFLRALPGKPHVSGLFMRDVTNFKPTPSNVHFECPFQVNFMGKSVRTVPYVHKDYASIRVLARLLSAKFLHREIREKGGAYGGGATAARMGLLSFYSYRYVPVHVNLNPDHFARPSDYYQQLVGAGNNIIMLGSLLC